MLRKQSNGIYVSYQGINCLLWRSKSGLCCWWPDALPYYASTEWSKENPKEAQKEGCTVKKSSIFLPCRSKVDLHSITLWMKIWPHCSKGLTLTPAGPSSLESSLAWKTKPRSFSRDADRHVSAPLNLLRVMILWFCDLQAQISSRDLYIPPRGQKPRPGHGMLCLQHQCQPDKMVRRQSQCPWKPV